MTDHAHGTHAQDQDLTTDPTTHPTHDATAPAGNGRLLATLEHLLALPATDVHGALDATSDLIRAAVQSDKVDIFLHDQTIDSLVAIGVSDTPMGRRQKAIGLDRLPLANGGPTVEVYRTGQPYNNGHNEADATQLRGVWEGMGAHSSLGVPLEVAGARRGVLEVDAARPDAFTAEDQRFLNAVARWVGMVAHRAELAEQLAREAAAQARRVAADELIEILAHDLRTPLTPAQAYLTLLRKHMLADGREQDVRYADQIALAHARLRGMIAVLLDAGRLEQGLFALEPRPVDLAALVQETVETLRTPEADVTVRGPHEVVAERVDPERLRQALENIVSNALAHAPEGTPVVVEVAEEQRAEGAWAVLAVRDEGPGIAPDLLPTLFDRFAREAGSSGLGLGLYLARGIATAHGGTLTVESRLGAGTTFRLALPLAGAPQSGRRRQGR